MIFKIVLRRESVKFGSKHQLLQADTGLATLRARFQISKIKFQT
jgi:hypothetical protein